MWHSLAVHFPASAAIVVLALVAWLKRKVIEAAVKALTHAVNDRFWKYVGAKASVVPHSDERKYKGTFHDFGKTRADEWFVTLLHDDVETKIRVSEARLFFGIPMGTLVEVDTEVKPDRTTEVIRRVRVPMRLNKVSCPPHADPRFLDGSLRRGSFFICRVRIANYSVPLGISAQRRHPIAGRWYFRTSFVRLQFLRCQVCRHSRQQSRSSTCEPIHSLRDLWASILCPRREGKKCLALPFQS